MYDNRIYRSIVAALPRLVLSVRLLHERLSLHILTIVEGLIV